MDPRAQGQLTEAAPAAPAPFAVVLHEPEIPNNTGNIGRTCVALGASLHLIHPLGFSLDEKARRRAGLDYWSRLDVREHADWASYLSASCSSESCPGGPPRRWYLTTRSQRPVFDADLRLGDHLVFGKETGGLPEEIIESDTRSACRWRRGSGRSTSPPPCALCCTRVSGRPWPGARPAWLRGG